jgi:hypothetical protein
MGRPMGYPTIPWDIPSHMGQKLFGNYPMGWDGFNPFVPWDDFIRPIPSHAEPWFETYIRRLSFRR